MSPDICLIITLTNGNELYKVGLKIDANKLKDGPESVRYWREPENYNQLFNLLPLNVQSCGKIVGVEEIFEMVIIS